ncbi:MAG: hypothetical protein WED87_01890, partial [Dehalococcoidia bacterium]
MHNRSDRLVALVVAVVSATAFACVAAVLFGSELRATGGDVVAAAFLAPLLVAGRVFPVPLAHRRRMVTDTAPLFAVALVLPPWIAAVTILPTIGVAEFLSGKRQGQLDWRQVAFNSSQAVLGVLASSGVFQVLAPEGLGGQDGRALLAVTAAALAMLVVNDLLVFAVVWAQVGLRLGRMAADFLR